MLFMLFLHAVYRYSTLLYPQLSCIVHYYFQGTKMTQLKTQSEQVGGRGQVRTWGVTGHMYVSRACPELCCQTD